MRVDSIFRIHIAKSSGFDKYRTGNTAFVSNGFTNNGILGFVTPKERDRTFNFVGICISAFCEATVQNPPFMGRGNGGSGVLVLEPLEEMPFGTLAAYAAYFNRYTRWRFSFGRMVSKDRFATIEIPALNADDVRADVATLLPEQTRIREVTALLSWREIALSTIFSIESGYYHDASSLPIGDIPLVSCGDENDGVMRFVDVPEAQIHRNALTIAYNGRPLTTKYHPYAFAAKDDVAVCTPLIDLEKSTLFFIQFVLNKERWRFSFGRKCFKEKLQGFSLKLPLTPDGHIDERGIKRIVENTSYWTFVSNTLSRGISLRHDILT